MEFNPWIAGAMAAMVAVDQLWSNAYQRFPVAVLRVLNGIHIKGFQKHIDGTAAFVKACGYSHRITHPVHMAGMALIMWGHCLPIPHEIVSYVQFSGILLMWISNIPHWNGAMLSLRVVRQMEVDASHMNDVLHSIPIPLIHRENEI